MRLGSVFASLFGSSSSNRRSMCCQMVVSMRVCLSVPPERCWTPECAVYSRSDSECLRKQPGGGTGASWGRKAEGDPRGSIGGNERRGRGLGGDYFQPGGPRGGATHRKCAILHLHYIYIEVFSLSRVFEYNKA